MFIHNSYIFKLILSSFKRRDTSLLKTQSNNRNNYFTVISSIYEMKTL
nr:MAG TPA: hypothetical protein [Crassvirales sp.]